jgi:uncharacterized protein YcbX
VAVVSDLYVYPIKACRGVRVERCAVVERGFEADRRWMIVDQRGRFVTQREASRLALVNVGFTGDALRVDAPGLAPLLLPRSYETGSERNVQIWNDQSVACRHPEGSAWFSRYLGGMHDIVYMPDAIRRPVNPTRARPGDIVGFADGYPFLLVSQASLDDLNQRLEKPVPMMRFRPNIVVSGTEPFAEDGYGSVRLGEISFRGVKRCDRCVVTTIDIETGTPSQEPLRTLSTFRLQDSRVWFGMNLVHDGPGVLSVGDSVCSP